MLFFFVFGFVFLQFNSHNDWKFNLHSKGGVKPTTWLPNRRNNHNFDDFYSHLDEIWQNGHDYLARNANRFIKVWVQGSLPIDNLSFQSFSTIRFSILVFVRLFLFYLSVPAGQTMECRFLVLQRRSRFWNRKLHLFFFQTVNGSDTVFTRRCLNVLSKVRRDDISADRRGISRGKTTCHRFSFFSREILVFITVCMEANQTRRRGHSIHQARD